MPENNDLLHVYQREISTTERSSLSVLAAHITLQASVLDLGLGSGALGRHLKTQGAKEPDGVTYNPNEAKLARPYYRQVEVVDLEHADLPSLFTGKRYDAIVCADVLEHLRQPERILSSCKDLLNPGGEVLISVPNVGYVGLLSELMAGEFKYRAEGLLDNTHLRFFTRQSLLRFLAESGWHTLELETVDRELPDSEFSTAFDVLPPAVSRHLLALPDALTYQFVVRARPRREQPFVEKAPPLLLPPLRAEAAQATFSAYLYLGGADGYDEQRKVMARGVIGNSQQQLKFVVPTEAQSVTSLRLDPADRPGFLRWHSMRLKSPRGDLLWQWSANGDGMDALQACAHHDIVMRTPWVLSDGVVSLLHGDDPWIELPSTALLAVPPQGLGGCVFEVDLGWPMSADYGALAELVAPLQQSIDALKADRLKARSTIEALTRQLAELTHQMAELTVQRNHDTEVARSRQAKLSCEAASLQTQMLIEEKSHAYRYNTLLSEKNTAQHQHQEITARYNELANHLKWIENSTVFRVTRPLVKLKIRLDRLRGKHVPNAALQSTPHSAVPTLKTPSVNEFPVDVIVPVYRGLADTQRCILSALASSNRVPFRLLVINDASPEPEVAQWLREVQAQHPDQIELLENPENLGFVGTVNRGMALHAERDVLLLNSDTEVANDWLDRIQRAAYSGVRIASVTPFSNNATICSYPRFCQANEMPQDMDTTTLDRHFAQTNPGQVIDVPTGVGFCMYIRRDALNELGLFDTDNFGKGYGEENDFCCRALAAGWRNVHTMDTFVRHAGGISFGATKSARELAAMETLRRLHPRYESDVHAFLARDPARLFRLKVDLARIQQTSVPVVLAVLHDRAGGTRRHAQELAEHLRGHALFLLLAPLPGSRVGLRLMGDNEALELVFRLPDELEQLLAALRALGVAHLHYHHLIGHSDAVLGLAEQLRVRYDFTAHDYYSFCPQISLSDHTNSYCGEEGLSQCRSCLKRSAAPGGVGIETWRAKYLPFLQSARHVLVPSRDAARRLASFATGADVRLAPHTDMAAGFILPTPTPKRLAEKAALRIVIIGALSPIKGADVLDEVAKEAARLDSPIEFHLLGYAYRHLSTQPRSRLTVHGEYQESDLPALLAWLQPDVAWFPALWPETYSYTLSACLQAGLPVVATDLGAFTERLAGRPWSWVRPWTSKPEQWIAFFTQIREENFLLQQKPAAVFSLSASAVDEKIRPWSYASDYLRGVARMPGVGTLSDVFLVEHQSARDSGVAGAVQGFKRGVLPLLMRLRSTPGLATVARAVPLRWQTRIKSWLRK